MSLRPAVAAAALLVLGAEAAVRDIPLRPHPLPAPAAAATDRSRRLAEARDDVARAEAAFGAASPQTARALADQAFLLWTLEDYARGLPIAERALAIRRAATREDAELAGSLYQVADFRRAAGDFAGALDRYRGAIAVWTRLHGPDHAENGSAWHYIGVLHGIAGDPERARAALTRALAIRERALGPNDVHVANTLQALAHLLARGGDAQAEALFARAQRIWEEALGPRDPMVARGLLARAVLRMTAGDVAGARPLVERALAIRLETFGAGHHLVARARQVRADLLAREGSPAAAVAESEAAVALLRAVLGPAHPEVASALAESSRLLWGAGRRADAIVAALGAERMARGQFLRTARDLDDALALRYAAARTTGRDVLLTALIEGAPSAAAREAIDALIRSRGMILDAPGRRARAAGRDPGLDEVRRSIPRGSAVVAYARYRRVGGLAGDGEPSYLAIVLQPGSPPPVIVALGPAATLEAKVEAWRVEVGRPPLAVGTTDAEATMREAGDRLRRAIWDPVSPAIDGASRVFIVPDGAIDLVSFAALPEGGDRFLVESGPLVHYLTAERDLARNAAGPGAASGVLAIGGPRFDAVVRSAAPARAADRTRPLCPEFAALAFEPLPGAAEEAREIAALAAATNVPGSGGGERHVLVEEAATAAAFIAAAGGRRVLHLATHAWVLPERCAQAPSAGGTGDLDVVPAERVLLRSGLAFAGANRRATKDRADRDVEDGADAAADDGILTAEQIGALDLSGVEWVVLSGCDTGLGEIHAGEGVVGLRHAFERAGAATVIMSLWGADDGAARSFMRALYTARRFGAATAESMRRAALDLLESQRARGRTTHPYYWGGFVAAGEWR